MVYGPQTVSPGQGILDAAQIAQASHPRESVQDWGPTINAVSLGADPSGTLDSSTPVQRGVGLLSILGGGTLEFPDGTYLMSPTIVVASNIRLKGASKYTTTLKSTVPDVSVIATFGNTLNNFELSDITIDCNNLGIGIALNAQCNGITMRDVIVKNAVKPSTLPLGWPVSIGRIFNAQSGSPSTNVRLIDCTIGPNAPVLENCILLNCSDSEIIGCTFRDVSGSQAGGLALYAYCHNVLVDGCVFANPNGSGGFGCYIQQSDTIVFSNCTMSMVNGAIALDILQVKGLIVDNLNVYDASGVGVAFGISDTLDADSMHFNGNLALYTASSGIKVNNLMSNGCQNPIVLYQGPPTAPGPYQQVAVNNFTDIDIINPKLINVGAGGVGITIGGVNAQDIRRINIVNPTVTPSTSSNTAAIAIVGNPGLGSNPTTGSGITGAAGVQQTVILSAAPTGIQKGQWITVDNGSHGTAESCWVYNWVAGTKALTCIFLNNHTSGAAIFTDTSINNTAPAVNGITDVLLNGGQLCGAPAGNSSGISIVQTTAVKITHVDLTRAKTGSGVILFQGTGGGYQVIRDCTGYTPLLNNVTTPTFSGSTFFQNTTGSDVWVYFGLSGCTVTHLYINNAASTSGAVDLVTQLAGTLSIAPVFLPAGQYIELVTSAGTPNWKWVGA